jgi:outer membrane protein
MSRRTVGDSPEFSSKTENIRLNYQAKPKRRLMMKRFVSISTLLLVAALTIALEVPLLAQEPASASAATGIVTVSFNAAVLQTAEAQQQLSALQTKYAPRQAQLKTLSDQVGELQKQLQAASDKLSDTERASREQSLGIKEKQLQRDSEDYKTDSQTDSQQVFQGVAQKMFTFLQTYAQQHGYSMIVERGSDAAPVVWYVAGNLDITDALVKAYNAQSGVAAPAATGAAKPAPASPQKPRTAAPAPK